MNFLKNIKDWAWDSKNKTMRGSFINFVLTLNLLIMIWIGVLNDSASIRLERMTNLMIALFGTSFGVWKIAKSLKNYWEKSRRGQE